MRKPSLLLALVVAGTIGAITAPSDASVAIALSLDEIARASSVVARVTPLEASAAWEDGRIVTTTRVRVDGVVAGTAPGELRVRTLGGVVGDVGQLVEGEPTFTAPSIVFLAPAQKGSFQVIGRAQGQLTVQKDVVRLSATGALVARALRSPRPIPAGPLMTTLDGAPVDEAARLASDAWRRTHAP